MMSAGHHPDVTGQLIYSSLLPVRCLSQVPVAGQNNTSAGHALCTLPVTPVETPPGRRL